VLPYLQWKINKTKGDQAGPIIAKWFKPKACTQALDAYWDPQDECVKNVSDRMLELGNNDTNDLYWATDIVAPTPKCKWVQVDKESLDDLVSTVKMAASHKQKALKPVLKNSSPHTTMDALHTTGDVDMTTVVSQNSVISQLTEQVSQIKMESKQLLDQFDWLAAQMEQFISTQTSQSTQRHAGGHSSESSHQTWWLGTAMLIVRATTNSVAWPIIGNHPAVTAQFLPQMRGQVAMGVQITGVKQ